MIRKLYIKTVLIFLPFVALSQSKLNKDRNSILKMCGCFEIEFKFSETFNYSEDENYVPSKNYRSFALEAAIPIVNDKKKISIQHLLIVGYGSEKTIVKHWRQDWIYENRDFYEYVSNNRWNYTKMKSSDVKGQWSQKVYQVDDSPRYEGTGTWVHLDKNSYWESTSKAPLPRREVSKRDDYNLMVRNNRHEIIKNGWVHDQDNKKISIENKESILIAEEKGYNTYEKVAEKKCSLAFDWWKENSAKWSSVRAVWKKIYEKNEDLTLKDKVDKMKLYEYLLFSDNYDTPENIENLINSFVIY